MAEQNRNYGTIVVETREQQHTQPAPRTSSTGRRICICLLIVCFLIILVFAYILYVLVPNIFTCFYDLNPLCERWAIVIGPRSPVHHNTTGDSYAVGFSLAAGYGTAAISFRNGTSITIGRYDGDDAYRKFMAKATSSDAVHPTPPYYCNGAYADSTRQWARLWRKKLGKPASEEIGALARVLIGLKGPVNKALGDLGPLKYATIATPYLPALFNEDLDDIAEYAGFQLITPFKLSGDSEHKAITDINFSFCGMRLGNCQSFTNQTVNQELDVSPESDDEILSVSYSIDMLTAHVSPLGGFANYFYAASGIADPWLGRGALEMYSSPHEYWTAVGYALVNATDSYSWRAARLSRVVVHSESATDPDFQRVLRENVTKYQISKSMPPVSMDSPLYAAALDAAELGKRCMLQDDGSSYYTGCVPDLHPKMQGW
ncbi:hypothetical protein M409DRAFT_27103 [Zasmidium cellare ATCC 36951]|uniref:Uncharacterized protein n=1 Tax=Zasmidium cellare ATCC 36951 TaxID=1080233 RepID=A0A6A6C898_ZASCE|nr:uncharacterized protein M409DRAFT_27103 [Zasmidium cellare ATCC 36951]KAF2162478.1 hypothetical protein M409DRAFT_27103 [Zasmidium cellare ATCC 36951]